MPRVYELSVDVDRFAQLAPGSRAASSRILALGEEPPRRWAAPRLRWVGAHTRGDFAYLIGHVPVVSDRALEVLRPLVGASVDPLPIGGEGGGYTALYVRDLVDCLDADASTIVWFEPGRPMAIEKFVFRPKRLEGRHLFRLDILPAGIAFLSGEAMDAIRAAGLTGLRDALLWEG